MQAPDENLYGEAAIKALPDVLATSHIHSFSPMSLDNKNQKIQDLVKKAAVAYIGDGLVRQTVDKFSELFKNFSFDGNEAAIKYLEDRLTTMSLQTGEHWQTLFTRIITEYFKTGNAFIIKRRGGALKREKRSLYTNKPYSISGLSLMSCERLTLAKDKQGAVVGWNVESSNPIDLVIKRENPFKKEGSLIQLNKPDMIEAKNATFLYPGMDIVQVAYKKGADCYWGYGITCGALEDISLARNLEQSTAIMMRKFSTPIIHHKITRPSSPLAGMQQEINQAYSLYQRMGPDGVLITGANTEIKAIGSESQALRVEGYLKYFLHRALAGMGMSPFLIGLENGGVGTVESAIELMMLKLRFCQEEIARELEMFLINELLWEGGFDPYNKPDDRVKLIFEDIDENRKIKLQNHAADLYNKNLIGHQQALDIAGVKGKPADADSYLNKVDMPKIKMQGDMRMQAKKMSSKEAERYVKNILPSSVEQVDYFIQLLERNHLIPDSIDLTQEVTALITDPEAIVALILEHME